MDCKQADMFFMRYAEKSIEPAEAKKLTEHLLLCENCRISFTVFDMCLDETETLDAPIGFTENVRIKVSESKKESTGLPIGLRVLWGLSSIVAGAIVFLVFNTEAVFNYSAERFESNFALRSFFENISASLAQIEYFGMATFLFVPLLGVLLYVLHTSEKSVEA